MPPGMPRWVGCGEGWRPGVLITASRCLLMGAAVCGWLPVGVPEPDALGEDSGLGLNLSKTAMPLTGLVLLPFAAEPVAVSCSAS